MTSEKLLSVEDLTISFKTDHGILHAVRGVSFDLAKEETLCIVGESGSGKSVTSKAIMGILANNAIIEGGKIMYQGENLLDVSEEEFHRIRGHKIGMIFQDPLSSLNPIVRIGKQITEAMLINSNKLKLMYEDLISSELIAYKNSFAKRNNEIKKARNEVDHLINNYNSQIEKSRLEMDKLELKISEKNQEYTELKNQIFSENTQNADELIKQSEDQHNKDIKDLQKQIEELKLPDDFYSTRKTAIKKAEKEFKAYKKQLIKQHKIDVAPLKDALKKKKAVAKKEVKAYKVKVKQEKKDNLKVAKAELKKVKLELKNSALSLEEKKNLNTKKLEIKQKIKQIKIDSLDKLKITHKVAKQRALKIMSEVGIPLPEKRYKQYPFEFSGGMRQRIVIAIALTASPEILICDEPTTALDVTIQAQILELIKKIQKEKHLACIFITHDLGVVANMADRIAVMYAGKIVEYGNSEEIFFEPKHPYTWALLSSIPDIDSKERLETIPGTPPNMIYPPKGDAFALRSKYAMKIDFEKEPPFFKVSDTHYAATWLLHESAPKVEMPKIVSERIRLALIAKNKKEVSENE